jgi:type I restriction enzyme R subunit
MYYVEKTLLSTWKTAMAANHIKAIRLTAKFLIDERGSVPQVIAKANDLRQLASKEYWDEVSVPELERMRESVRDLMPLMEGRGPIKVDVDIRDVIFEAEYVPEDTAIDIRTYREKVIDYLAEHSDSEVIRKIHNLEPINRAELDELEQILWHELGSREEYDETTQETNLAAFIRSLIGLNQEAVNEKFSDYLSGNMLNAKQQEFVRTIINYVRENGDVDLSDMVNTEPFNNYDLTELFGERLIALKNVVEALHGCIQAGAA